MDKQQFDHIENRIRQAADEISVPFSIDAWKKMEIKLDNEFNKGRRRGIIWWWFSLMLLGIAAFGVYVYKSGSPVSSKEISNISSLPVSKSQATRPSKTIVTAPETKESESITSIEPQKIIGAIPEDDKANKLKGISEDKNSVGADTKISSAVINKKATATDIVTGSDLSSSLHKKNNYGTSEAPSNKTGKVKKSLPADRFSDLTVSDGRNNKSAKRNPGEQKDNTLANSSSAISSSSNGSSSGNSIVNNPPVTHSLPSTTRPAEGQVSDSSKSNVSKENTKSPEPMVREDSELISSNVSKKKTPVTLDNSSSKGFYFIASVAGDATGIKSIEVKDTKPVYGAGIGYRFNNKLSVQTGFYFGKKVYSAGPDDYKVKPGSFIAKIISAEAECYIYDIPLTVRYDVFHKQTSNLYLASGLSSYFLKRETYDMHFFNPTGTYRHMSYTYTHNVNYLSVFNLSVGYERKISKSLYIQGEPYLKIPLGGLGEGGVKLYSAGLQLGIKYQPLKRKK